MSLLALPYPVIDPVLVQFGPFAVRWYALAYIAGLIAGLAYIKKLVAHPPRLMDARDVDDFLVWAVLGIILGGRIGYVLFYKLGYYVENPAEILMTWRGGMSFHGGMLGLILVACLFARRRGIPFLHLGDMVACAGPIGLFLGRIANFINGELFGRVAPDWPLAMVFPEGGPQPRHPSQLYEATLEGLVLFAVLHLLWRRESIRRRPGTLGGAFLIGYGLSRWIVEYVREPDAHLGLLAGGVTMGQILSLPMILAGVFLILIARRNPEAKDRPKAKDRADIAP